MMNATSEFDNYLTNLEKMCSQTYKIQNPETNLIEEHAFISAIETITKHANALNRTISNCMNRNLELAKNEDKKKLNRTDYQKAMQETNVFERKVTEFEALAKIFKDQKENFCGNLTSAKMIKNLSKEEFAQLPQKEKDLEKITTSISNLLKIVDDQNKKSFLRYNINWLGNVVARKGVSPGWIKSTVWPITGADSYQFKLPKKLKGPIQEALENWSKDPIEQMKVIRELAAKLDKVASQLGENAH